MDSILFKLGFDPIYLIGGIIIVLVILLIITINTHMNYLRLKNKYMLFMKGKDGKNLEESIVERFYTIDKIQENVNTNEKNIAEIKKYTQEAYQKIGIVKYDAFHEMGGKLSFALTMLNDKDTGWLINAMHSREGCYTYIKEIVKGESYIELSEEELESLQRAKYQTGYGLDIDINKGE